jgi:hypothetical protein
MKTESAFVSWLIANFELAFFWVVTIIGVFFLLVFGNKGCEEAYSRGIGLTFLLGLFLLAVNTPSKSSMFQYGRYLVMMLLIIFLIVGNKEAELEERLPTAFFASFWIFFAIATAISAFAAYYAYVYIDEVLSRRMLWRNSNASLFEFTWKYVLDRFCNISVAIITCVPWLVYLIYSAFTGFPPIEIVE